MQIFSFRLYISHVLLLVVLLVSAAFPVVQYTYLSRDSLTVGDRIQFVFAAVTKPGAKIVPPDTDTGFGDIVVKDRSSDLDERAHSDSTTHTYILTSYTVGVCSLPPLPFLIVTDDTTDTLYSEQQILRVQSVIDAQEGDTIDIKDLKGSLSAGKPSLMWLWILLSIAGIAAIIALARHLWIRSRKPPPPPPPKPPYEEAIEALAALESKEFQLKGLTREYVFALSDIFKRYIGRRFDANIAENTTEEILEWVERSRLDRKQRTALEWFFNTSHMIKFAKVTPDKDTTQRLREGVTTFLEATKPGTETKEPENKGDATDAV